MSKITFTSPVGRLVYGSLYTPRDKDAEGQPLMIKSGPNAGKPRVDFSFGLAIPKGGESHWNQTEWGKMIHQAGREAFPQAHVAPSFAWKVQDGDSTVPNKKGIAPVSREGFAGHWILSYSSSFAPTVYGDAGATVFHEVGRVKTGHYVQVFGNVGGNGSVQNPGVFLNHSMVCFIDFGPEIVFGPDATGVGFQAQRAASTAPAPAFGAPHVPAPTPAAPQVAVAPNPAILAVPPAPAPAAPARVMTPAANGLTYEQYVAAGWTDAQLIQHGMMVG